MHIWVPLVCLLLCTRVCSGYDAATCEGSELPDTRHFLDGGAATTHCPDVRSIHCVDGTNNFYAWNYETPREMRVASVTPTKTNLLTCDDASFKSPVIPTEGPFRVMPLVFFGVMIPDGSDTFYCVYDRLLQTYDPCTFDGTGVFDFTRCRAGVSNVTELYGGRSQVWLRPSEPRVYDTYYMRDEHARFSLCGTTGAPACAKTTVEMWCVPPVNLRKAMSGTECYCSFPTVRSATTSELADVRESVDPWSDSCAGGPQTTVGSFVETLPPFTRRDVTSDAWPGTTLTCPPPGYIACMGGTLASMDGTFPPTYADVWSPFWQGSDGSCIVGDAMDVRFVKMYVHYTTHICDADYAREKRSTQVHNALAYSHTNTSVTSITCSYAYGNASLLSGRVVTMSFMPFLIGGSLALDGTSSAISGFATGPWAYSAITRASELTDTSVAYTQTGTCVPDAARLFASDDHRVRSADACACALRGITYKHVNLVPLSHIPYMGCCGALVTDAGRVDADGPTGGMAGREIETHCHAPQWLGYSPGRGGNLHYSYGASARLAPPGPDEEDVTVSCPPGNLLECVDGLWFASSGFAETEPSQVFTCNDAVPTTPIVFDAAYLQIGSEESPSSTLRCTYTVAVNHPTAAHPVWEVRLHLVRPQVFQQHAAVFVPATNFWGKHFGYQWDCDLRQLSGSSRNVCKCAVSWRKAATGTAAWAIPFMWSRCCTGLTSAPELDLQCMDAGRVMLACPAANRLACTGTRVVVSSPDPEASSVEASTWKTSLLLCSQMTDAQPMTPCQGRRTLGNTVITACPLGSGAFRFLSAYYDNTGVACSYQVITTTALKDLTFVRVVAQTRPTRQPKISPGVQFSPFVGGMRCSIPLATSALQTTPELGCPFYATPSNLFSTREAGNAHLLMAPPPTHPHLVYHYATCPPATAFMVDEGTFSLAPNVAVYGNWVRHEYTTDGIPYSILDPVVDGWPVIARMYNTVHDARTTVVCEYASKLLSGVAGLKRVAIRYSPGEGVHVKPFAIRQDDCVLQPASTPHIPVPVCECYKHLNDSSCECAIVNGQRKFQFETSEPLVDHCGTESPEYPVVVCPPAAIIRCDHQLGFYIDIAGERVYSTQTTILGAPGANCWTPSNISQPELLHTELTFMPQFPRVAQWDCAYKIAGTVCDSAPVATIQFRMRQFAYNIVANEERILAAGCDNVAPHTYQCVNLAIGECDSISAGELRIIRPDTELTIVGPACCDDVASCILGQIETRAELPTTCDAIGSTAVAIPLPPYIAPYTNAVQKGLQCMKSSVRNGIGESIGAISGNNDIWTTQNVRWASCPDPVRDDFCYGPNNALFKSGNFINGPLAETYLHLGNNVTTCPAQHTTGSTSKLTSGWALILVEITQSFGNDDTSLVVCYYSNQYNTLVPDYFTMTPNFNFDNKIGTYEIDSLLYAQFGSTATPADKSFVYSNVINVPDTFAQTFCARSEVSITTVGIDEWLYFDALPTCGCPFLLVDTGLSPTTEDGLLLNSFGCAYDHLWTYWPTLTTCPPLDCLQYNAGMMVFPGFDCIGDSCGRDPNVATKFHFAKARLFTSGRLRCIYAYYTTSVQLVVFDSAHGRLYANAPQSSFLYAGDPTAGEPNFDCCYDYTAAATEGVKVTVTNGIITSVTPQYYGVSSTYYISGLREPYTDMSPILFYKFIDSKCDSTCDVNICPKAQNGKYDGALYNNVEMGTQRMCPPAACVYSTVCPLGNIFQSNILSCQFVQDSIVPRNDPSACLCNRDVALLTSATFVRADYRRSGVIGFNLDTKKPIVSFQNQYVDCVYVGSDAQGIQHTFYLNTIGVAVPGPNFDLVNAQYPQNNDQFFTVFASCIPINGNADCGYYQSTTIRMPYDASYPDNVFPCTGFDCINCEYDVYVRPLALPSPSPTPFPSPTPTPSPSPSPTPSPTPTPSPSSTPSPTPTPFPSPSPVLAPSPSPSPSPTPSPTPTPFPSPSPNPSPTPTPSPLPSPSPSPSPSPEYGPVVRKIIRRIETYMTITTCPPASCLTQFAVAVSPAVGTVPGTFTLQVPNFPQCILNSVSCNATLATYDTAFTRVDVWYRPESIENPECSYIDCVYTNAAGDALMLTSRFADHRLRAPAYIPAFSRSNYWEVAFQHDTCSAGTQDLECACPVYRTHGVQVAWDSQGCCCDIVANPECDVVFGPVPKLSGVCQDAESCRAFQPVPTPAPSPPVIPCPPPPLIRKQQTTCPPSSIITYGNNGWFIDGDDADSYTCDPEHSNGCVVDGRILDSSVAFRQLEIVLDGSNVMYIGCSYSAIVVRNGVDTVMYITMSINTPADYAPNYGVMYAPDDNPAVLACNTPEDQFHRDVCKCPFNVSVQKNKDSWADCCCNGESFAPCVLAGIPCPTPTPTPTPNTSPAARNRVVLLAVALIAAFLVV